MRVNTASPEIKKKPEPTTKELVPSEVASSTTSVSGDSSLATLNASQTQDPPSTKTEPPKTTVSKQMSDQAGGINNILTVDIKNLTSGIEFALCEQSII